ncbi:MAG: DNA polymerase III subunit delta [Candidatus Moranbacteria bacterium RIFOXYA12_FULL_35_19]|nr:MAG: polymerase III, delta subunit protein [Candidatus Moranbacteria bacterium GW2011_GWF2_35_39]OGI32417.1 MAG: DNA polymerase III subunit delta [Candidatus Moranbacteria bacterium RIFOXYC12_FULL_36_13]OGI32994.1 MAG: DNA polymerase III subunit delta [Candidatus Moranbacteria bacterium RIFOXYB12_FULL_35_8]OGI35501.1 MAG: DNA polymerase III subunit delta [Candidatus Moranbacteria bacterium RIFOXYA12_FULL_35_19]
MIIFLFGADSFRSSQKISEIKNKFMFSDKSGSGLSVFDYVESLASKDITKNIINTSNTPNLLATKRLIIVKNLISNGLIDEQKKILEFLKKKKNLSQDSDGVIIFWEGTAPKKNNALYKFFISKESGIKSQNFEKLVGVKLEAWVLKIIKEINLEAKISKLALARLIAYCGEDIFLLYNEIQKLIAYADNEMISEKNVDLLVKANLNNNIFCLVDAIGANDKKQALKLFHEHLQKGDDPFYLMSMFFYQFRNMLKIADLYEKGMRAEYDIARMTKLHPFVVKKTIAQMRNFSFEKLKKIYKKLGEIDRAVKTGKIEIKLALDKFVVEL